MFLESAARQGMILASGFAEGKPGQSILMPTMEARRSSTGYVVTGSKKPCSLARSMDVLTASVALPSINGHGNDLAIALIPAKDPHIKLRPFWNSPILAGAESDEVIVDGVEVPEELLVRTESGPDDPLDDVQLTGFVWFELLMTASYLGTASGLVERALEAGKGSAAARVAAVGELETAMSALERAALCAELGESGDEVLVRTLQVRYSTQDAIERAVSATLEMLGGMAFIRSPEVGYLATASKALAFHPPARAHMSEALLGTLDGDPLQVR
jgi:alkylation response protein AidB-like acyl-CoA dehydrogenase